MIDETEKVEATRMELYEHYNSKINSEILIILTIGIVFLTAWLVFESFFTDNVIVAFFNNEVNIASLTDKQIVTFIMAIATIYIAIRQTGRFIWWRRLSETILTLDAPISEKAMMLRWKFENEHGKPYKHHKGMPTLLYRLNVSCSLEVIDGLKGWSLHSGIWKLTKTPFFFCGYWDGKPYSIKEWEEKTIADKLVGNREQGFASSPT